jgi:hypothetical protein
VATQQLTARSMEQLDVKYVRRNENIRGVCVRRPEAEKTTGKTSHVNLGRKQ